MAGHLRTIVAVVLVLAMAACAAANAESRTLTLRTLNDSGVTGSVTLVPAGDRTTVVRVEVDPAGHPNMPAHIHPGTCDALVPQPRFPLQSVIDGTSTTEVPASMDELINGAVSINLHKSNDELEVYTACVELR